MLQLLKTMRTLKTGLYFRFETSMNHLRQRVKDCGLEVKFWALS